MKNKKKLIALMSVLGISAIGGTFAYFNQTMSIDNIFDTGIYDTELVEKFNPADGENWEPGTKVDKEVYVENIGTLPVVARVKFAEEWKRKGSDDVLYTMDTSKVPQMLGTPSNTSAQNKFENVYQGSPEDGQTGVGVDDSVVHKTLNRGDNSNWVYNPADGYYYYKKILLPNESTDVLLKDVTLAENIDMGKIVEKKYYATTADRPKASDSNWKEFEKDGNDYVSTKEMSKILEGKSEQIVWMKSETQMVEGAEGYSNADYTLTVTAHTVQATDAAVQENFGLDKESYTALKCDWDLVVESETYNGDPEIASPSTAAPGADA